MELAVVKFAPGVNPQIDIADNFQNIREKEKNETRD